MSHVDKDKFGDTNLCNSVDIYDMARFFPSEQCIKTRNNPSVLKMIYDFQRRKKNAEYCKRSKGVNRNVNSK